VYSVNGFLEPVGLVDRLTLVSEDHNPESRRAVDAVFRTSSRRCESCEVDRLGDLAFGVEDAVPGRWNAIRLAHPRRSDPLSRSDVRTDPVFGDIPGIVAIITRL
jgi:hypothetical protein